VELESLGEERKRLEACLAAKDHPAQVVETRLTERRQKPSRELVDDSAQAALREEWDVIATSATLLEQKLVNVG
jgi:hypothetical protein